jgi:hypothetical protein
VVPTCMRSVKADGISIEAMANYLTSSAGVNGTSQRCSYGSTYLREYRGCSTR